MQNHHQTEKVQRSKFKVKSPETLNLEPGVSPLNLEPAKPSTYPPSVQSDLFNYLKPAQREAIRPYLRIVKPQYQEMLCVTLLDYLEGHGLNPLMQPVLNLLQEEIVQACNLRPLTSSRLSAEPTAHHKVQGSKTLGDLVRQLFPSLSSIAPHSGLDTPHSGLRAGTPSNQEMPHQVRHEDKTVQHEDLNPESAEGLNLETSQNSQTPQTPQTLTAADLPPAIRAFWDSAPAPFKVPAILTAIDCYCALATRLRFKYTYDLDPHALLLQVLVVAEVCE